nr:LOW QUALITY PROTEIN: ras GTPase-activating protein 1-like [Cherax quadricarinatus]
MTNDWMAVLRPLCVPQMVGAPKLQSLKFMKSLHLTIMQATRLPSKIVPSPYCLVSLNQDQLQQRESKHQISGASLWYFHDLIMPCEEYNSLKELLLDPSLEAVQALADVSHRDRNPLATSLLRIFRNECREHDLLQRLTEHEIEREHETSTLFRAASLTTTLLDLYMKSTCTEFLTEAISDTIHRILESKQSCELNPTKMDNPMDACANAEFLLKVLDDITQSIFASAAACPIINNICNNFKMFEPLESFQTKLRDTKCTEAINKLKKMALDVWLLSVSYGNMLKHARLKIIIIIIITDIILHYFCTGITEPPHPVASRSLIMIAKCLQNLANLVEFGGKEPYMEVVNPFILKNKERMITYLDTLSSVSERPEIEEQPVKSEPSRDLAQLHHICVTHIGVLTTKAKTQVTLKKLVTVTDMLKKHKEKYQEMMR